MAQSELAQGLVVSVAAWPDDAEAPVCLMVDDLTDGWIDVDGSGEPRGRNDWGAGMDRAGSSFDFLERGLLREFPEVRTTFFVPVARVEDVRPARFACHFQPIDRRPEFVRFLRDLDADRRFECAYHGKEHGHPGATAAGYVPEFAGFRSAADALSALRAGEQIWKGVFGRAPAGGKYPAYTPGEFGDVAVDLAGYTWWCRRWDRDLGPDGDPTAFHPRVFGERGVVDLPSTLHGGVSTAPDLSTLSRETAVYHVLVRLRGRAWLAAQIDALLRSRAVITVQEHVTSSRPDGLTQTPNVYDDAPTLREVFARLRGHRVWHATCGEIAAYWRTRVSTQVRIRSRASFEVLRTPVLGAPSPLSWVLNGGRFPDLLRLHGPARELRVRVTHRHGPFTAVTEPVALEPGVYEIAEG